METTKNTCSARVDKATEARAGRSLKSEILSPTPGAEARADLCCRIAPPGRLV